MSILDDMKAIKDQINDIKDCVGITFTPEAWELVKHKMQLSNEDIVSLRMYGIPCYIMNKQVEDCIGWFDKEMMELYLSVDGDIELTEKGGH